MTVVSLDDARTHPAAFPESAEPEASRADIEAFYSTLMQAAQNADRLSAALERDGSAAAGGRARRAIGHIWHASEEVHQAFHHAPQRTEGPHTPVPVLCARRARYLARQIAKKASA